MNYIVGTYLGYVAISVLLTIWVAQTLSRAGAVFLEDVFEGKEALAEAVNRLLVVGFYLLNIGFVLLALRTSKDVTTMRAAIELLSIKLGIVLLVLGGLHLTNMAILHAVRRGRTTPVWQLQPNPWAPQAPQPQ